MRENARFNERTTHTGDTGHGTGKVCIRGNSLGAGLSLDWMGGS